MANVPIHMEHIWWIWKSILLWVYDRVTLNMKETNLKRLTQCLDLKRLTKYLDNKLRDKGEKGKEKKEEKR